MSATQPPRHGRCLPRVLAPMLLLVGGSFFLGCGDDSSTEAATAGGATKAEGTTASAGGGNPEDAQRWLFTLGAGGTTLQRGAESGAYTLTLSTPDENVLAFADRPERDAALVPTAEFVDRWNDMFASSPPNAVVVEHDPVGEEDALVVELSDPVASDGSVTFTARLVAEDDAGTLASLTKAVHQDPPSQTGAVSAFIDSGQYPSSCTYDQEHGTSSDPACGCPITFTDGQTFYMPC